MASAPIVSSSNVSTSNINTLKRYVSLVECTVYEVIQRDLIKFLNTPKSTSSDYINQQVLGHTTIFSAPKTPSIKPTDYVGGEKYTVKGSDSDRSLEEKTESKSKNKNKSNSAPSSKTYVVPDSKIIDELRRSFPGDIDSDSSKKPMVCLVLPDDASNLKVNGVLQVDEPDKYSLLKSSDITTLTKDPKVDLLRLPNIEAITTFFKNLLITMGKPYTTTKSAVVDNQEDDKSAEDVNPKNDKSNVDEAVEADDTKHEKKNFRRGGKKGARKKVN